MLNPFFDAVTSLGDQGVGLGVILFCALVLLVQRFWKKGSEVFEKPRSIRTAKQIDLAVDASIEQGTGFLITWGAGKRTQFLSPSVMASLSLINPYVKRTLLSDHPIIFASGDSLTYILLKNLQKAKFAEGEHQKLYRPSLTGFYGLTPLCNALGLLPTLSTIQNTLVLGYYNTEIALIMDAQENVAEALMGGSESLVAQPLIFLATQNNLIGENIYAFLDQINHDGTKSFWRVTLDFLCWSFILLVTISILILMLNGLILQ